MLESTYEKCLSYELSNSKISHKLQLELPVIYKGVEVECGYRLDLLVADKVIIELKSVEKTLPIHDAQLLTYLMLSGKRVGLLMNFNVKMLKNGIKRFVI